MMIICKFVDGRLVLMLLNRYIFFFFRIYMYIYYKECSIYLRFFLRIIYGLRKYVVFFRW